MLSLQNYNETKCLRNQETQQKYVQLIFDHLTYRGNYTIKTSIDYSKLTNQVFDVKKLMKNVLLFLYSNLI